MRQAQRGDTLIEVLFAITVFSLVVVGALSLMNQGSMAAQRSLEMTLVRQEIDAQSEALRFLHGAYTASYQSSGVYPAGSAAGEFRKVVQRSISNPRTAASTLNTNSDACPAAPTWAFVLNPRAATYEVNKFQLASSFAQLQYNSSGVLTQSDGIWIEAVRVAPLASDTSQAGVGYIDFHIRACWNAPGQARVINLGTIVRLYEPRA